MCRKRVNVTASEMMELREQGYSNHDIAAMLEISQNTVYRYIGKQPGLMVRLAAFDDKPKKAKEQALPAPVEAYTPKLAKEEYQLCGGDMMVTIDHGVSKIFIETDLDGRYGHGCVKLDYEQARELVQFLAWASRERCKARGDGIEEKQIPESEG